MSEGASHRYPRALKMGAFEGCSNRVILCFGAFCLDVRTLSFWETSWFSIKPLQVKVLEGEQKATES